MLGSHHIVHLVMRLRAKAVRTRVNSGASPHHRIVFREDGSDRRLPGLSGLQAAPFSRSTLPEPGQSADVVRTRMNAGVSPHHASGDEAQCRSGENPRQQRRLTTSGIR